MFAETVPLLNLVQSIWSVVVSNHRASYTEYYRRKNKTVN